MSTFRAQPFKRKFISAGTLGGRALVNDGPWTFSKIFAGELFEEIFMVDDRAAHLQISLMSLDRKDTLLECHPGEVREVGSYGAKLLLPVRPYEKRLEILQKNRLDDAHMFEAGSHVTILLNSSAYPGIVRYVGEVHGKHSGIYFGVELPHHPGHGETDGSFGGRFFFRCQANSGVFVTIDQLHQLDATEQRTLANENDGPMFNNDIQRRQLAPIKAANEAQDVRVGNRQDSPQLPVRSGRATTPSVPSIYPAFPANTASSSPSGGFVAAVENEVKRGVGALAYGTAAIGSQIVRSVKQQMTPDGPKPMACAASVLEQLPLRLHDEVFIFNDKGDRHQATVRWIGRVSPTDKNYYAGLELKDPVGHGTGVLNGEQLFVTRPNYAMFTLLDGLVKVSDAIDEMPKRQSPQPVPYEFGTYQAPPAGERNRKPALPTYSEALKQRMPQASSNNRSQAPPPARDNRVRDPPPPVMVNGGNGIERTPVSRVAAYIPLSVPVNRLPINSSQSHGQLAPPAKARSPSRERQKHTQIEEKVIKTKVPKKSPSPEYGRPEPPKSPQKHPTAPPSSSPGPSRAGTVVRNYISDALEIHNDDLRPPTRTVNVPPYSSDYGNGAISQNGRDDRPAPPAQRGMERLQPGGVELRRLHPDTEWGKNRGIQGHKNSCYLDATLFGMFAFSNVFDDILFRKRKRGDGHGLEEVQAALREIMFRLRGTLYVPCDDVMRLRELLQNFSDVSGMTDQEKDPEEFLSSLLEQSLKIDPLLKLTSCDANWYTLFVEKNLETPLPTVQDLFDSSLMMSDVRLKEAPKCLILQTPRSGAQYKMYRQILPSPTIDITDAIVGQARPCCVCGDLAQVECKDCFGWMKDVPSKLSSMAFCRTHFPQSHKFKQNHKPTELTVKSAAPSGAAPEERVVMELFAVVCIKTSHYVTFAKDGDGMWYFVDSMADREGGDGNAGFNIPEVRMCPELLEYLVPETGRKQLLQMNEAGVALPEPINRFFEDCYLCMYQPMLHGKSSSGSKLDEPLLINTSSDL